MRPQFWLTRRWCWNRYIELARETTGLELKSMRGHAVSFTKGFPSIKLNKDDFSNDSVILL